MLEYQEYPTGIIKVNKNQTNNVGLITLFEILDKYVCRVMII